MTNTPTLGLDVGALAIKVAVRNERGAARTLYRFHRGNPERTIAQAMREFGHSVTAAAVTGSGGKRIAEKLGLAYVDPAVALVAAARDLPDARHQGLGGQARHIIDIGGGSLSIVDLDEEGRFAGFRTNSLCAAGTGSFLDEQSARMGLSIDEMSKERTIADPPRIAARCAVFAKSDLIHHQQQGCSIQEMWSGLCRGMVQTALSTLFRGRKPAGPVIVAGGVALNREVVRWLKDELDAPLIVPDDPETFSARGAIAAARPIDGAVNWDCLLKGEASKPIPRRPKLDLILSKYPSFDCQKSYADDATEVRIHSDLKGDVVIGIDIGSTSTKAAVLDLGGRVIADFYRRTSGDPIGATQKILAAISRAADGSRLTIKGTGTTGSGRKMVGAIIGADRIINEITAHAKGAVVLDPDVETVFEIGGQDSKFIALKEGSPHDSNMNYVCAAGTGSFVEEQAKKLDFALAEIGDAVMGTSPPFSTDRCTVFMEQDVHALIRAGFDRREAMGSVLYSVVQNYLNKVVGRRPYSRRKICFMGATARNKGLVAAFEKLLDAPISVSPYCHVMGAYGVALIVLDEVVKNELPAKFRGLAFADQEVELRREVCELCVNTCRITRAIVGPSATEPSADGPAVPSTAGPSWGYMCGRDPDDHRVQVNRHFDAFRKRERLWQSYNVLCSKEAVRPELVEGRTVRASTGSARTDCGPHQSRTAGMPRALLTFTYGPLWSRFFRELGVRFVLSSPTHDGTLVCAADFIGSEYCYPVKLAHGHVRELALDSEIGLVFLPHIVLGEPHDDGFDRSVFCPYNIALPSIVKASGAAGNGCKTIASAVINLQRGAGEIARELHRALGAHVSADRTGIERAWRAALSAQEEFASRCESMGRDALKKIEESGGKGVVILGRSYNVCDTGANLNLPQKIADLGLDVLTVDMLPLKGVAIDPLFHNMYWRIGRKILQAATLVAGHPNLYCVFLTNFGCGPDSFLQSYVEKIMLGKPMLMLELDEHSADAGYVTRLEAFYDVINKSDVSVRAVGRVTPAGGPPFDASSRARKDGRSTMPHAAMPQTGVAGGRTRPTVRTLWIPPMHPYGSPLLAAALRSVGRPARALPTETIETFELAKRFCRGTECVPLPSTIGAFLNVLKKSDAPDREAFFMPSAKGPCRFGQYHTLHRIILDEAGYKDTPIEAWSDESGSYGTNAGTSRRFYNAMLSADLLFKARCRIRPYAADRDEFDKRMDDQLSNLISAVEAGGDVGAALAKATHALSGVERRIGRKPLVGIVGEIYVRLNPFTNQRLIETIEDAGGEAWVAPIVEWFHYLAYLDKAQANGRGWGDRLKKTIKNAYMMRREHALTRIMSTVIADRLEPSIEETLAAGERVFPRQFEGESILTVGRAIEFSKQGVDLIINCAPFGCMPGTLTSGIFQRIEPELGVPVVSLFFDGETDLRHLVRTYMANLERS